TEWNKLCFFNCAITHKALEFAMSFFPSVRGLGPVDPDVRASAVDCVNRVNWLFETWDLEGTIAAFAPDASVYHFHGELHGEADIRRFLIAVYPYLIPGV